MCDGGLCDENKNIKCYKMLYVIFLIDKRLKKSSFSIEEVAKIIIKNRLEKSFPKIKVKK